MGNIFGTNHSHECNKELQRIEQFLKSKNDMQGYIDGKETLYTEYLNLGYYKD